MTAIGIYGFNSNPASQEPSFTSERMIQQAVSRRHGSLQTTLCIQDPPASAAHDSASIFQQLFRHVSALVRLTFALCIIAMQPAARLCRSLHKSLFGWLDTQWDQAPHCAQRLGTSLKFQIRIRWPRVTKIIDRTLIFPARLIEAVIEFPQVTRGPHDTNALQESSYPLEAQIDTVVTIRLVRRSPISNFQYENTQDGLNIRQILAAAALDDIPTLEERSVAGCVGNRLLGSSPSPDHAHDTNSRPQSEVVPGEHSPMQEIKANVGCQISVPTSASPGISETSAPMQNNAYHSSINPLEPPQKFLKGAIRPTYNMDEAIINLHRNGPRIRSVDTVSADAATSSVSSDPAHDESFSPEQLPFPYTKRDEPPAGVRARSTCSSRAGQRAGQPSPMPSLASDTSKPQFDRRPSLEESQSSDMAQDTSPNLTKWARRSWHNSTDSTSACNYRFHETDDVDYCASETTSSYEESCKPTTGASRPRRSEAGQCTETCTSCETCDRRHNRARHSRIPRRTKALEHFHPRSASFTSCYSAQSMGSAGTVVRRESPKRKIRMY